MPSMLLQYETKRYIALDFSLDCTSSVTPVQALYVARRPERTSEQATRIKNPTWWTRCILFICCVSTQSTEGHQ
jgi:hypothetical protein